MNNSTFKKLILAELLIIFLATTFMTDSPPPGWYQQTLPRTDNIIQDIYFSDSLTGWAAAVKYPSNDTGFVFHTTNGGLSWSTQFQSPSRFYTIEFLDNNTGYLGGGNGPARLFKTTDAGNNWINISTSMVGLGTLEDMFFINTETGWVCDANSFGGLAKTTNGGTVWQQQLNDTYKPFKLFFINKDTGWANCNLSYLYRTTNGGANWDLQYSFPGNLGTGLFFTNKDTGFVAGGGVNTIQRTTNGGVNWSPTFNGQGGTCIFFINNSSGWSCSVQSQMSKTTNGGSNWFSQITPLFSNNSVMFVDTSIGWVGGNGIAHTTDGGGISGIIKEGNKIPSAFQLYQNYPNPFNPSSAIRFEIKKSAYIKLAVYDIRGKEIEILTNKEYKAGTYEVNFDAAELSSGIYFYSLFADRNPIDSKKMLFIK
jgi:photosystem II stability/assembly factor-like uncharacterized protein